jgi:hypothetical protein
MHEKKRNSCEAAAFLAKEDLLGYLTSLVFPPILEANTQVYHLLGLRAIQLSASSRPESENARTCGMLHFPACVQYARLRKGGDRLAKVT